MAACSKRTVKGKRCQNRATWNLRSAHSAFDYQRDVCWTHLVTEVGAAHSMGMQSEAAHVDCRTCGGEIADGLCDCRLDGSSAIYEAKVRLGIAR